MFDIALALVEFGHFFFIDVKTQNLIADIDIAQHQGQADIAQADNADFGAFVGEFLDGCIFHDSSLKRMG